MYQKLRKTHLLLRMKPLFVISLVYGLIFLIEAFFFFFVLIMCRKIEAGTRIQKPALAAPSFLPHVGGPAVRSKVFSVTQLLQPVRVGKHFRDGIRFLVICNHFSYTKRTSFRAILLYCLENLREALILSHLREMANIIVIS